MVGAAMKIEKYTCDVCSVEKGPSNHWWLFTGDGKTGLYIEPFRQHGKVFYYACGERCASKLLSRWMTTRTLDAPKES